MIALEVLLRCSHSELSKLPISTLISLAEQAGCILELGAWISRAAIEQAETWRDNGLQIPTLSLNLSAVQINDAEAMQGLRQTVTGCRIPPSKLQFEITETAMLNDVDQASTALLSMQRLGIHIALDDYGTGHSSLAYLRRFRPDTLKIDRCFVREIATSYADETLVAATIAMAQRMGMHVVAEGVETKMQYEKLRDLDCDAIQGYYISRPVPVAQIEPWLAPSKSASRHRQRPLSALPFQV